MRISTAPWEDAADLDAGIGRGTAPIFLGSLSDLGSPFSDLSFHAEIWSFSVSGGTAEHRDGAERREEAFLPAHQLANRVRVSAYCSFESPATGEVLLRIDLNGVWLALFV